MTFFAAQHLRHTIGSFSHSSSQSHRISGQETKETQSDWLADGRKNLKNTANQKKNKTEIRIYVLRQTFEKATLTTNHSLNGSNL